MSGKTAEKFGSFEEFEREYMPVRHASRQMGSDWTADRLASELTAESLRGVQEALERSGSSA